MNELLTKLYLTIFIQRVLIKLKTDNLTFINVYISKEIYDILIKTYIITDDNKKINFILDPDRSDYSIGFDYLRNINVENPNDFFNK
jgi:hypothetical protein